MRRIYYLLFLILFFSSCNRIDNGYSEIRTNYVFLGKDKQQLTDLSEKWFIESLGINEIKIKNQGETQKIVSVKLNDLKINIKIIIHDESAEIRIQKRMNSNNEVTQSELNELSTQYEEYINLFSSNGIWERPKDYQE